MLLKNKILLMAALKRGYQNLVINGNLANGISGYSSEHNTLTIGGEYLLSTSKGNSPYNRTFGSGNVEIKSGNSYYCRLNVGVTNDLCINIKARLRGSISGLLGTIFSIDTPLKDQVYTGSNIFTATDQSGYVQVYFQHEYSSVEVAIGKVMKANNIMVVDISNLSTEQKTLEWCDANIPQNIIW